MVLSPIFTFGLTVPIGSVFVVVVVIIVIFKIKSIEKFRCIFCGIIKFRNGQKMHKKCTECWHIAVIAYRQRCFTFTNLLWKQIYEFTMNVNVKHGVTCTMELDNFEPDIVNLSFVLSEQILDEIFLFAQCAEQHFVLVL